MNDEELLKLLVSLLEKEKRMTITELYQNLEKKIELPAHKGKFSGILHGLAMGGLLVETRGSGKTRFYSLPKKKNDEANYPLKFQTI